MNILIRCDGSKANGFDHVLKYIAFADKLKSIYKCPITFAMRKPENCIKLVKEKYPVLTPHIDNSTLDEQEWIYNLIKFACTDILILDDKDALNKETLNKIKRNNKIKVLVADIYKQEKQTNFINLAGCKSND